MDLNLESEPFFVNRGSGVEIYRGSRRNDPGKVPIVMKKYDCTHRELADSVNEMNLRIREGLAQARTEHPHVCKVLEVRIDINEDGQFSVSHVLEALEKDVNQYIEERKQDNKPYTEMELLTFLLQVSQALSHMHSKVTPRQNIAHRDIKPANLFFTNGDYKVGDFASFWEKESQGDPYTENGVGTPVFMSPQAKNCVRDHGEKYQPFKNDVYSLGATALNLAALIPPLYLKNVEHLYEVVQKEVGLLGYSEKLKALLREMVSASEEGRPLMQEVVQRLMPLILPSPRVEEQRSLSGTIQFNERGNKFMLIPFSPEEIKFDPEPLYRNAGTEVVLYKATRTFSQSNQPQSPMVEKVVVKSYKCGNLDEANYRLREGVKQSQASHPHVLRLLDIYLALNDGNFCVNLVLSQMECDCRKFIMTLTQTKKSLQETELLKFLTQVGGALAHAHSRVTNTQNIAHRDIKPENVLLGFDKNYYLGDFGSFWEKNNQTVTDSIKTSLMYASPQLREVASHNLTNYNPFKGDVYSLGITLLELASLTSSEDLWTPTDLEQIIERKIRSLGYSNRVKNTLRKMLDTNEATRPTMNTILKDLEQIQ